jgi:hypothetical protein
MVYESVPLQADKIHDRSGKFLVNVYQGKKNCLSQIGILHAETLSDSRVRLFFPSKRASQQYYSGTGNVRAISTSLWYPPEIRCGYLSFAFFQLA